MNCLEFQLFEISIVWNFNCLQFQFGISIVGSSFVWISVRNLIVWKSKFRFLELWFLKYVSGIITSYLEFQLPGMSISWILNFNPEISITWNLNCLISNFKCVEISSIVWNFNCFEFQWFWISFVWISVRNLDCMEFQWFGILIVWDFIHLEFQIRGNYFNCLEVQLEV